MYFVKPVGVFKCWYYLLFYCSGIQIGLTCTQLKDGHSPCIQPNLTVCINGSCECHEDATEGNNRKCVPRKYIQAFSLFYFVVVLFGRWPCTIQCVVIFHPFVH
jgi:hypothetical protein